MNWDKIEGNWNQVKGVIRKQWNRLTDDQLEAIAGRREKLVVALQECYGIAENLAEQLVASWEARSEHLFEGEHGTEHERRRKAVR